MTKPVLAVEMAEKCTWATEKLCYLGRLITDETQYVTWFLVFLGWVVTIVIAYVQYKKGAKASKEVSHNEWVREFREKLESLEDEALIFWTTNGNNQDLSNTIVVTKLTRNVKELTTIARDIKIVGGADYKSSSFKELRQSITNDKELDSRPLPDSHYRVVAIRKACSDLRRHYRRKSD